jgi:hypothetical protein
VERTQISLEPAQAERLRALAKDRGVSMAHLIREAVDRTYGSAVAPPTLSERWERAMAVVGVGGSDLTDLAEGHDRYLDESYAS